MGCCLEDDVTSGPAPACCVRDGHHHGLQRDQDELMLLCDERVDEDESNDGVVENTSSSASSSRHDVNLSSREDEAATGGDDSHSNTATALLLNKDIVGVQQQPVEDEHKEQQQQSLYALRRNPKRSQRFIDEEFALEISAGPTPASGPKSSTGRGPSIFNEKARACTECGKEFSSWKALFGHMRCHPEREWRGIQKPVSIHQLAAKSGLKRSSSKSAKSRSQGQTAATMSSMSFQEDRAANGLFKVLASDDESDTESIEAAYMNGGGFFSSKSDPRAMAGKITGKRSKRQRTIFLQQEAVSGDLKEERDMANCLVMLASAGQKSSEEEQDVSSGTIEPEDEDEVQLAEEINYSGGKLEEEKQNSIMVVAVRGCPGDGNSNSPAMTLFEGSTAAATTSRNLFVEEPGLFGGDELLEHMKYECATCKRIFKSHQALGGHRASHKKVKGCFARTNSDGVQQQQQQAGEEDMTMIVSEDELVLRSDEQLDFQDHYNGHHHGHIVPVFVSPTLAATASASHHRGHLNFAGFKDDMSGHAGYGFNRKQLMKAHECSICHRVFTSGQALGGHKRCHWGGTVDRAGAESQETSVAAAGDNRISSSSKLVLHGETASIVLPQKDELLDLNLPAQGQAGEDQVEVEIVGASLRRGFQQETKIVRKPETESAAGGGCTFEQLPRLVPAYTLVKRKKEAAAGAAKLATKKNSGTALNGLHQLGLGQTTVAASMTPTTTKRTVQAPASAG